METKPTQTKKVDAFMAGLDHPLKEVLVRLRTIILSTDKDIGEEIKWNAPTFFYSGPMKPSAPKLYKRYLLVSNARPKHHILLVLLSGARVDDGSGFLEGDYPDGRRLLRLHSLQELEAKKAELQKIIKRWLKTLDKN